MGNSREWTQCNAFHPTQDGCTGANAQSEAEDSQHRESRSAPDHAEGIAQVAQKSVEESRRVEVPYSFAHTAGTSQLEISLPTRFLGRHAGGDVLIHFMKEMRIQLSRQVRIFPATMKKSAEGHWKTPLARGAGEYATDGLHQLFPAAGFGQQLLPAFWRQAVILGLAVVFTGAPIGADPATVREAMQGWIERALLHLQ